MMRKSLLFAMSCFLTLGVNGINVYVKPSDTMSCQDRKEMIVAVENIKGQPVKVRVDAQDNNNSGGVNVLFGERVIRPKSTENFKVVSDSNGAIKIIVYTSTGECETLIFNNVKPSETKNDNYVFGSRNGFNYVTKETSR